MKKVKRDRMNTASVTVEAAFVVPIFFVVFLSLIYLMEFMYGQQEVERELRQAATTYACHNIKVPVVTIDRKKIVPVLWTDNGSEKYCTCSIWETIPGLPDFIVRANLYQRMEAHDYSGLSMKGSQKAGDEYVYISKTGRVYHKDISCTYLKLNIKKISGKSADKKRNASGGKYKACIYCTRGHQADMFENVYITEYGDRYHCRADCSILTRNVKKVRKREVGGMPGCSKCVR